jgi:hypothetical protein
MKSADYLVIENYNSIAGLYVFLPVLKDPALRVTAQKVRKVNKKKSQAPEFTGAGLAWWPWKVGYSRRT